MASLARLIDPIHRLRRRLFRRPEPPKGILIISAGGLGDTVLFSLVAERFSSLAGPRELVTVLLRHDGVKTAFCLPDKLEVLAVNFGRFDKDITYRWKMLETLFKANYRLALSTDFLRHPFLDETMIAACDALEAIAMKARPWPKYDVQLTANRRLFTRIFDSGETRRDKVVRWNDFANWITGKELLPPEVRLTKPFVYKIEEKASREVIIQPFSAIRAKQVAPTCYEALINALPSNIVVRITGLNSDLDAYPEIRRLTELDSVVFDPSTFSEIAPRLQTADLVISVDTALMHLAVALGAPTLCLASAAYVGEIVPYDPCICPNNVTFLYENLPCAGCLGDCIYPLIDGRYACVEELTPQRVVEQAQAML